MHNNHVKPSEPCPQITDLRGGRPGGVATIGKGPRQPLGHPDGPMPRVPAAQVWKNSTTLLPEAQNTFSSFQFAGDASVLERELHGTLKIYRKWQDWGREESSK